MAVRVCASGALLCLAWGSPATAQDNLLREAARLDMEQKCGESELLYQRLLVHGPPSPAALNNLGNHYLICGQPDKARVYFERLLKLNPVHSSANLQLARIAVEAHQGTRALEYLARVQDHTPATRMLRAEALHWAGKRTEAEADLDGIAKDVETDPHLAYLYGVTCARVGAYERAVAAFNRALTLRPDDYQILFSLGRAAARAQMYERAQQALETAVKLRPGDFDALMELAGVEIALRDYPRAVYVLVQAEKLAPDRPEVPLALAHAAQAGGYYGDAAVAYDTYLRLKPDDDTARRDRALACGFTDARQADGLKELRLYIGKHPQDALGHYYMAQLTWRDDPQAALRELDSTLRLDPKFAAAHVDAGWLMNREGKTAEAIPHFEKAIALNPKDARALDQLGAAYLSLDRPSESEKALRQAAAILPADPEIMMHLGRALIELGRDEEGRQYLEKFRTTHPATVRGPWRQPGLIESASLPAGERTRHEIERLEREAGQHPDDPELELRLASLLLIDGRLDDAEREFRVLLSRNAESRIWQQAGSFLLAYERYFLAKQFLERAAASNPAANVDLAAAVFFSEGPERALSVLESTPITRKTGDYLLLKAKILDAAGRREESGKTLEEGLALSTSNPRIAQEAARLLVRQDRKERALAFLSAAANGDPDLLLMRAIVLALLNQNAAAEKALKDIQSQWPEWDRPYTVQGLLLEKTDPQAAKQKLQTAMALGAQDVSVRCALARLGAGAASDPGCSCAESIKQMILSSCATP